MSRLVMPSRAEPLPHRWQETGMDEVIKEVSQARYTLDRIIIVQLVNDDDVKC